MKQRLDVRNGRLLDDAAQAALEMGAPSYRFLRRYLERRPPVPLTLRQVDPLIRQLTLYRDLIDQKAGDPTGTSSKWTELFASCGSRAWLTC